MATTISTIVEVVSSIIDDYGNSLSKETTDNVPADEWRPMNSGPPPPPMGPPPSPPPSDIGLILSVVCSALIIVTNVVTLIAFAVERRLRTYNNHFLISLAVADLLVGFMVVSTTVNIYFPTIVLCKLNFVLNDAFLTVSVLGIVVICIDRHQATYNPIAHFTKKGTRRALMYNIAMWALSLAFWLPYTAGWDLIVTLTTSSDEDPFRDSCVPRYSLRVLTSLLPVALTILLPALLIGVLYVRIIYKIRTSLGAKKLQNRVIENPSKTSSGREESGNGGTGPASSASGGTGPESSVNGGARPEDQDEGGKGPVSCANGQSGCSSGGTGPSANGGPGPESHTNKGNIRVSRESSTQERKATRTLTFIFVAFVVAWVPHVVFLFVTTLDRSLLFEGKIPEEFLPFISLMRYTNSFLNPICYAVAQPLFRKTVFNLFRCKYPH